MTLHKSLIVIYIKGMNQPTKIIYRFHNLSIGLLLIVMVAGGLIWYFLDQKAEREWKQVQAAMVIVKEKINYQPTDIFSGCVHPENGVVIVSVNHESFFGVKESQVFIPRLTDLDIKLAQKYGADLPVESHDINPYYLYEYCRY